MAKKGSTSLLLFQVALLGGAIAFGLAGRNRLKPPPPEAAALFDEMIFYSLILTEQVESSIAKEKSLLAEGLEEEIYLTVDIRRNAMLEWLELKQRMPSRLSQREFLSISTIDIYEHPHQLQDQLTRIARQRASHLSAYLMLGSSGLLFLVTFLISLVSRLLTPHESENDTFDASAQLVSAESSEQQVSELQ